MPAPVVTRPQSPIQSMSADLSPQHRAEFDIYGKLQALLTDAKGSAGPKVAHKLFDEIMLLVFAHAVRLGRFRLPAGLGALALVRRRPGRKRLPNGDVVVMPPRVSLKLVEGDAVKLALGRPDPHKGRKNPSRLSTLVNALPEAQAELVSMLTQQDLVAARDEVSKKTTPLSTP